MSFCYFWALDMSPTYSLYELLFYYMFPVDKTKIV